MNEFALGGAQALAGLLAGVYVAFLVAFMPALHGLDDATFTRVFVRIDKVIVNPAFLALFLGAPVLATSVLVWERSPLAIAAAVLGVLAMVVTFAVHLPLNAALARGGTRKAFETPWLAWHAFRTLAATASFVAVLML
jgi:uncharacterized membrane protein